MSAGSMCTIEEVEIEVNRIVEAKLNDLFWRMVRWMGGGILGMSVFLIVAWVNMQNDIKSNKDSILEGGRYTQEEHDVYAVYVDSKFSNIDDSLDEIKQDVKDIRNAVIK